ncbi:MAG TPA: hypothetical protein VFF82_13640 [Rhodocyclaceae bacterium]|nr:hypothetical protein [Rhodocyclaceae bacterium]
MYERLRDCPALNEYPSHIPAATWNAWRRYWMRHPRSTCFGLLELPPLSLLLDEREWVLVDTSLYDMPVLAWSDFDDQGRTALHEPVACRVRDYHQGAAKVRNRALQLMAEELESRLHPPQVKER